MIYLFVKDSENLLNISSSEALPASEEQAVEIFEKLTNDYTSCYGLVLPNQTKIHLTKYNTFLWKLEIFPLGQKNKKVSCYSKPKCLSIIQDIFRGNDPLQLSGTIFEID